MYFGGNSESLEYKSRAWYQREESRVSSVEICEWVNEFNMLRKSLKVDTEGGRKPGIFCHFSGYARKSGRKNK